MRLLAASWSVVTDKTFFNRNIPQECHDKMLDFLNSGHKIVCVAFPPASGNSWSVVTDKTFFNRNVAPECHQRMQEFMRCHGPLRLVAFDLDANGWSVVSNAKHAVIYRLPFSGTDPAWKISNGNWDDPTNAHAGGNQSGLQAYAFDFTHPEGGRILAARGGKVHAFVESESGNSWGSGDPCKPGVGNYLVIDHGDGTFGVYWHMQKDGVLVTPGSTISRGQHIALSGNTGNSSEPHLHFDVRTGWDLNYRCDILSEFPSIKIYFQDKNHICWIPRVGDTLAAEP